jgi:tripartite-type tricarboxylate transporter receptor subunit TctC
MRSLKLTFAAFAVALLPALAAAQGFPNKPIKLIVPFPPGGPNDIIARAVGQKMSDILKQPVLIDNRGGQGGVLGTDAVAKADPDGYTIGVTSAGALAISPSMQKIAYDTLKDLAPVTLVAKVPEMLVVATGVPANNMKELVALAKAQPGKLNFASSGPGSLPQLAGELFKLLAKIDIVHVPYRGAAPAVNDLLGQQVQMAFFDLPVLLPQVQAGKLRAIAIGAPERSAAAKDVPTTAEAGMPDLQTENWYGMAQQGCGRGDERPASDRQAGEPGRDARRQYARSVPRLHRCRNQEMGARHQGSRSRTGEVSLPAGDSFMQPFVFSVRAGYRPQGIASGRPDMAKTKRPLKTLSFSQFLIDINDQVTP